MAAGYREPDDHGVMSALSRSGVTLHAPFHFQGEALAGRGGYRLGVVHMQYTTLGRTGLKVSVAGLGCGGHSCLGLHTGKTERESIAIVRRALELGINVIDTAEAYQTEPIVGKAVRGRVREHLVISTKKLCPAPDRDNPTDTLRRGVERSLERLQTDYLDVFYLHGVRPKQYEYARDVLFPVLARLREQGKLRFIGVTEAFIPDPQHAMAKRALADECWDVMMIGFNVLNQSARDRVFPITQAKRIGTMGMFAVRNAFSRPQDLTRLLAELRDRNQVEATLDETADPLGFLTADGKAATLAEAAYRYCRHEPGMDIVLTGTGNIEHLEENVVALLKGPLLQGDRERLAKLFARVDSVSGDYGEFWATRRGAAPPATGGKMLT